MPQGGQALGDMTPMPTQRHAAQNKGATDDGKSIPPASPQAVTTPRYLVVAQTLAKVWLPTTSTAPAQRSLPKGLPGDENFASGRAPL